MVGAAATAQTHHRLPQHLPAHPLLIALPLRPLVQPAKKWEAVLTELKYGPGPTPEATADKNAVQTPVAKV